MKKILKSVLIIFSALAISCSTDDVQDRPVIEGVDSPVLSAPESGSTYTLEPENMTQQIERFVWSKANYNGDVAISYSLEIDVEGGDFTSPQILGGTTGALQLSVSHETLNLACLALGATPYSATNFDVRVVSSASGFDIMGSNKVTITITPYTTETPKLYVIGNFLNASGYGADWTPANTLPALASSGFGQTDFEGYVYMNVSSPEFKLLPTNTSFDGDYGDDGNFTGNLIQTGESNIQLSASGYYRITANTDPTVLSYNVEATRWAITGSATPLGWPDNGVVDQDLTYNPTTKKWEIIIPLTAGGNQFKFRANDAWTLNYGDDGNDGTLEFNSGSNLSVSASGTYLVELDLSNPRNYTWTATLQ